MDTMKQNIQSYINKCMFESVPKSESESWNKDFKVGDSVKVICDGKCGKITDILPETVKTSYTIEVDFGDTKLMCKPCNLEKFDTSEVHESQEVSEAKTKEASGELKWDIELHLWLGDDFDLVHNKVKSVEEWKKIINSSKDFYVGNNNMICAKKGAKFRIRMFPDGSISVYFGTQSEIYLPKLEFEFDNDETHAETYDRLVESTNLLEYTDMKGMRNPKNMHIIKDVVSLINKFVDANGNNPEKADAVKQLMDVSGKLLAYEKELVIL